MWQSQLPKEARLPSVIPAQPVLSAAEGAGIHSPSDNSTFSQREDRFRLPHFTTGALVLHLIRTSFCSALKNKQLFPFSTSFISGHLARSPP
jgi:hypothetical protein